MYSGLLYGFEPELEVSGCLAELEVPTLLELFLLADGSTCLEPELDSFLEDSGLRFKVLFALVVLVEDSGFLSSASGLREMLLELEEEFEFPSLDDKLLLESGFLSPATIEGFLFSLATVGFRESLMLDVATV